MVIGKIDVDFFWVIYRGWIGYYLYAILLKVTTELLAGANLRKMNDWP
jgi:hypothetical protein